ncbi:hypothetical protein BJ508DRAFT_131616 [Ascobolus immersus RN42]|uniref:Uncharacterized protein n=1 Tax=Ascobolus immersus RN42 TaxID=1160509 RepID=A0A3N4IE86_ASCIM|nr:hypothetical protein BJ508DRAFT_131616 [Ascobolus immersus RN42]
MFVWSLIALRRMRPFSLHSVKLETRHDHASAHDLASLSPGHSYHPSVLSAQTATRGLAHELEVLGNSWEGHRALIDTLEERLWLREEGRLRRSTVEMER